METVWRNGKGEGKVPTIGQLTAHVFEVVVAHVVHAEDVEVGVLLDAFLDVGVEAQSEFFIFLLRLGGVDDFGALGFGHCGEGRGRIIEDLTGLGGLTAGAVRGMPSLMFFIPALELLCLDRD